MPSLSDTIGAMAVSNHLESAKSQEMEDTYGFELLNVRVVSYENEWGYI